MKHMSMRPYQESGEGWNALIAQLPGAHLLQTWEWGQLKAAYGWQPLPFVWESASGELRLSDTEQAPSAAAMVLRKQVISSGLGAQLCLLYVPKGPLLDWSVPGLRDAVLDDLQALARRERAIFIKIDPDVVLGRGVLGEVEIHKDTGGQAVLDGLQQRGWILSTEQIQFKNTVMIDLSASEEQLLAQMKQKARYNVRLAEKKGVSVRTGTLEELPLLYKMYAETAERDRFVIRNESYYRQVWGTFMQSRALVNQPGAEPLIAEVAGEVVAAIFVFYFADRAYYLHGMSRAAHREKMPNHLLQWEAIKRAKRRGCRTYDLWGAPDELSKDEPMWGVFRFKEGLGGEVVRTLGAWDYPASRIWYPAYTRLVPRILDVMRWRGRQRTRQDLAGP